MVVVGVLLGASGLGSFFSARIRMGRTVGVLLAILGFLLGGIAWLLAPGISAILAWPLGARLAASAGAMALPGFLMGFPFPTLLRLAERRDPSFLPWVWAANGAASVIAAILATLLAVSFGFRVVLLAAAGSYLAALACLRTNLTPPR